MTQSLPRALLSLLLLLLTLPACVDQLLHARSPAEQDRATALIKVTCTPPDPTAQPMMHRGSGVLVSDHYILTAQHVTTCPPGQAMAIVVSMSDTTEHAAVIDIALPLSDVVRLRIADSLASWQSPVILGPEPTVGQTVCQSSAAPRRTYRCGMTQATGQPGEKGDVRLDIYTEFGNSGSGVYDQQGRLVGLTDARQECQDPSMICQGFVSGLWPRTWLLE